MSWPTSETYKGSEVFSLRVVGNFRHALATWSAQACRVAVPHGPIGARIGRSWSHVTAHIFVSFNSFLKLHAHIQEAYIDPRHGEGDTIDGHQKSEDTRHTPTQQKQTTKRHNKSKHRKFKHLGDETES